MIAMAEKKRRKRGKPTSVEPREPTPSVALVPQVHGGALLPGGTGAGGRPPDLFRAVCRQALEDAKGIEVVKAIISGDIHERVGTDLDGGAIYGETKNKDRLGAIEFLANYGHGKPPQEIKMSGNGANADESGEAVMQRLLAMVGRALLAAPAAQRLAVIHEIERADKP